MISSASRRRSTRRISATRLTRGGLGRLTADGCYEAFGRRFRVGVFPIGIDTPAFRQMAEAADRNALVRRMAKSLEGKHLIIGVDRLDYSKGIAQRIDAFSCFLENDGSFRNRVTFLQITPKSRSEVPEYAADAARPRGADRAHQRSFRRRRLDADPLHQQADRPHGACRPVPSRARRPRDAAARRHEPRRQGVRGGAVARRSGRARAVALCRRRPRARRGADRQSVRHRRHGGRDQARARDAARRAPGALERHDGAAVEHTVDRWCTDFLAALVAEDGCDRGARRDDEAEAAGEREIGAEIRRPRSLPLWGAIKN